MVSHYYRAALAWPQQARARRAMPTHNHGVSASRAFPAVRFSVRPPGQDYTPHTACQGPGRSPPHGAPCPYRRAFVPSDTLWPKWPLYTTGSFASLPAGQVSKTARKPFLLYAATDSVKSRSKCRSTGDGFTPTARCRPHQDPTLGRGGETREKAQNDMPTAGPLPGCGLLEGASTSAKTPLGAGHTTGPHARLLRGL